MTNKIITENLKKEDEDELPYFKRSFLLSGMDAVRGSTDITDIYLTMHNAYMKLCGLLAVIDVTN